MLLPLLFSPLLSVLFASNPAVASSDSRLSNQCILDCANSALCSRSPDATKLKMFGRLVDSCQCPTNYGGVACDIPLYTCTSSTDCHGADNSCQDGLCNNACAAAAFWLQSSHYDTEHACRKAITQFCSNDDDDDEYCTNGGQCTSGYRGVAAESLADPSLLCQCAPEFTGRHCERVNLPPTVVLPPAVYASVSGGTSRTPIIVLGTLIGAVVAIVLIPICVAQTKRRIQEQKGSNSAWGEADSINTHDLLLQIFSEDIDEELAAAMMAANSAARPSNRNNRKSPNTLV